MFNRVLGRQDEEWIVKWIGSSTNRDLPFLHRFKERTLDFGRCAVYLIGEDNVGENGSLFRIKIALLLIVDKSANEVCWEQIRCELQAIKRSVNRLGKRTHGGRLCQSRYPFKQNMPVTEQSDQQPFQQLALPDDYFSRLCDNLLYKPTIRLDTGIHRF